MRPHAPLIAIAAALLPACSSTTIINSRPSGARLFLNGEAVGQTPYTMTDTKIVGATTTLRFELPGYEPLNAAISRSEEFDVGACIGGVFLLVPFLWIQGYKPMHDYELRPAGAFPPGGFPQQGQPQGQPYPQQPQPYPQPQQPPPPPPQPLFPQPGQR